MRTSMPRRLLLAGVLLAAIPGGLAACGGDDSAGGGGHQGHDSAAATTTPAAAADAETASAAFVRQMIPHHESAVEMAKDVVEAGEHSEIRALASDVIASQTKEIAQLKAIAKGDDIEVTDPGTNEAADAQALGLPVNAMGMSMDAHSLSGDEPLDLAFIDAMIPHHDGALAMAAAVLNAGATDEVQILAEGIVKTQAAEIAQMQGWRKQWYPDAPAATTEGRGDEHDMSGHDTGAME